MVGAAFTALILAACGAASSSTPTSTASDTGRADALLAASAKALQSVRSYHVRGMIDPGLDIDMVVFPRGATGTMSEHGVTWQAIVIDHALWVRGAALWQATLSPAQAAALGDGWVRVTDPAAVYGLGGPLRSFDDVITGQVFGPRPGLAVSGSAVVDGRQATELRSSTDLYDIAAAGTPYPLRWLDSDSRAADGSWCGVTLDDFDAGATATPPATVVGIVGPTPTP